MATMTDRSLSAALVDAPMSHYFRRKFADVPDEELHAAEGYGRAHLEAPTGQVVVVVAEDRGDRCDGLEFAEDPWTADITRVDDALDAFERVVDGRRQPAVRIGDDADQHPGAGATARGPS